jgi:hypothetical protein
MSEQDSWSDSAVAGFIEPVSMEDDPAELFAGDAGTLDADVRRVLVQLLRRKFLLAEKNTAQWRTLLENQQIIESRLHDLFVRLVVDHDRGIAYKQQVRSAELDVPILLKDDPTAGPRPWCWCTCGPCSSGNAARARPPRGSTSRSWSRPS